METKRGQIEQFMFGIIILIFGGIGVLLWSLGFFMNLPDAGWVGKVILALVSILVLVIERFIK